MKKTALVSCLFLAMAVITAIEVDALELRPSQSVSSPSTRPRSKTRSGLLPAVSTRPGRWRQALGRGNRYYAFRPRYGTIGGGLGTVAGIGFGSVVANGGGYPGGYTAAYYGDCGYGFAGPLPVSCDAYPY